jgi:hypothetical protein
VSDTPELSVICIAGPDRRRTGKTLGALASQTAVGATELVLVDGGAAEDRPKPPGNLRMTVVPLPARATLGQARTAGLRAARGSSAIAFILDHCYPRPEWAEALLEAYRTPWAAVGFAFECDNPRTYGARAAMIADHGPVLRGVQPRKLESLSSTETSYSREFLDGLGAELPRVLDCEFFVQGRIPELGKEIWLEPRALVVHENLPSVLGNARASYQWSRLIGGRQLRGERWGVLRRIFYALLSPLAVPVLRTVRLIRDTRETVAAPELATALPAILVMKVSEALGLAHGYLLGDGDAARRVMAQELYPPRAACR